MKQKWLLKGKYTHLIYQGNSMKSTFQRGDLLTIEPIEINRLKKGDIIAYLSRHNIQENNLIVHRIIKIAKNCLITKGDNNRNPDIYSVEFSRLMGKVTSFERYGKCHRVIGGWTGMTGAKILYLIRRIFYLFFSQKRNLFKKKLISFIYNSRITHIKK